METSKTHKILIVEDNMDMSSLIAFILNDICEIELKLPKPEIKVVATEDDAIREVKEGQYDLITLDTNLASGGSGVAVFRQIKKENHEKVVNISTDETVFGFYRDQNVQVLDKVHLCRENLLPVVQKILQK